MKLTVQQYASALYGALQEVAPKDQDRVIENFVQVLKRNQDLDRYEAIIAAYEAYDREQRGVKQAEVTVAREMEVNAKMLNDLNKIIGDNVEVRTKVDENIIGGMVIRVDDTLIDASIKGQLKRLKSNLSNN